VNRRSSINDIANRDIDKIEELLTTNDKYNQYIVKHERQTEDIRRIAFEEEFDNIETHHQRIKSMSSGSSVDINMALDHDSIAITGNVNPENNYFNQEFNHDNNQNYKPTKIEKRGTVIINEKINMQPKQPDN